MCRGGVRWVAVEAVSSSGLLEGRLLWTQTRSLWRFPREENCVSSCHRFPGVLPATPRPGEGARLWVLSSFLPCALSVLSFTPATVEFVLESLSVIWWSREAAIWRWQAVPEAHHVLSIPLLFEAPIGFHILFFFLVGMYPRTTLMPGKWPATELHPQSEAQLLEFSS